MRLFSSVFMFLSIGQGPVVVKSLAATLITAMERFMTGVHKSCLMHVLKTHLRHSCELVAVPVELVLEWTKHNTLKTIDFARSQEPSCRI